MSVYSDTFGFKESCQRSHEFVRRGCSKGPTAVVWVGDFLVTETVKVKQSEQIDIRGGEGEVAATYAAVNETCEEEIIHAPQDVKVENTDIREDTDHSKVFDWVVPKYNAKGKLQWDTDILASSDAFCGVLTDGGNCYFNESVRGSIDSICGSIHRDLYSPTAYFLDNRNTLDNDEDKGLLFVFVDGMLGTHEVRWVDDKTVLTEGLENAEDITAIFKEALSGKGVLESEIYSFGMI